MCVGILFMMFGMSPTIDLWDVFIYIYIYGTVIVNQDSFKNKKNKKCGEWYLLIIC